MPKVSIVLPVYNGEKYLSESIESVINQTFTDWELIIVDDCSTDMSNKIANDFAAKDTRISVIRNEVNSKTPKSLNNGFAIAKGEYFSWTSDDNIYHASAIEKMVQYLDDNLDIGLVSANMEMMDEKGKKTNCNLPAPTRDVLLYSDVVCACFLYKREIHFSLNGYDEAWFLVEDYDFWLRASRDYKFGYIPDVLYTFRTHKKAQSYTRRNDVIRLAVGLLEREQQYAGEYADEYKLKKSCVSYSQINYRWDLVKKYMKELKAISPERYKQESIIFKAKEYVPVPVYYFIKKCVKNNT